MGVLAALIPDDLGKTTLTSLAFFAALYVAAKLALALEARL